MSDLVMACEGGSNSPSDAMCRCRITPYQHPSYPEETSSELRQAVSEINLMLLLFDMPPRAPIVAAVSEKLKSPLVRPELRFFFHVISPLSLPRAEKNELLGLLFLHRAVVGLASCPYLSPRVPALLPSPFCPPAHLGWWWWGASSWVVLTCSAL